MYAIRSYYGQSEAGAALLALGGEKGIAQSSQVLWRDAAALILYLETQPARIGIEGGPDGNLALGRIQGLAGIDSYNFV